MAFCETALAVVILANVILAGLGLETARKLGKHFQLLRRLWAACRRRHPHVCDAILSFEEIWDAFTESTLDFEDRFAVFCDSLGDLLESIVQRMVDWLEWLFELNSAEQSAALSRVPRLRVTEQDSLQGVGKLAVTSCAICFEQWKPGEEARLLPACSHAFHCKCVDQWLYRREQCPLCRRAVAL